MHFITIISSYYYIFLYVAHEGDNLLLTILERYKNCSIYPAINVLVFSPNIEILPEFPVYLNFLHSVSIHSLQLETLFNKLYWTEAESVRSPFLEDFNQETCDTIRKIRNLSSWVCEDPQKGMKVPSSHTDMRKSMPVEII